MRWLILVVAFLLPHSLHAETHRIVTWNVLGTNHDPVADLDNVKELMATYRGTALWGLSEVPSNWASGLEQAAEEAANGRDMVALLGTTGTSDRLLIFYDATKFEQIGDAQQETDMQHGNGRAPLWVKLKDRSNGTEFIFMVNHLHRGNEEKRRKQASQLRSWAMVRGRGPVISVGDFNFDYELPDGEHNEAYFRMTKGGVWEWVRPSNPVKTSCHPNYNGVLDFVFVANDARNWQATSKILEEQSAFCARDRPTDPYKFSDHRPVQAFVSVP